MSQTNGIHHITALAGNPVQNYRFYNYVLGLRLVKKTVNPDNPTGYHLYYGNESADPGSVLSFLCWENLENGKPERGQVVAVSLAVPTYSKQFWINRLQELNISATDPFERFGCELIGLQDPDGLHLELVFDPAANDRKGWESEDIPANHTVRGLYGATLAEKNHAGTGRVLEQDLGFRHTDQAGNRYCYRSKAHFGSTIEVIDEFGPRGKEGKGTVHHLAFRVASERFLKELKGRLFDKGYYLTEIQDSCYFKSAFFHEPGGVLFELATEEPGFSIDEPQESLGTALKIPSELERIRHRIEAELPDLTG